MTGPAPSRALILSGSIGKGHDVVAEACAAALGQVGVKSDILDCMGMLDSGPLNRVSELIMKGLMAAPGVYDAFHFRIMRPGGRIADAMDAEASRRLAAAIGRLLDEQPAELLLTVFATGAGAGDRLKAERPGLLSVVYCTDACPHRLWLHPGTDLFLATSAMSAAFARYHAPAMRTAVIPPAARPAFYHPPTRAEARSELGVPDAARCVLVMAGAWGMGPVDRVADLLAGTGVHVLAVAGNNGRLHRRLEDLARRQPRVHPFGFTGRIPALMAAADLVVTTAGDTCTEARLLGRPLLLLDTVPGHGRENVQLELARGGAAVTALRPDTVVAAALDLLEHGAPPSLATPATSAGAWTGAFLDALAPLGIGAPA